MTVTSMTDKLEQAIAAIKDGDKATGKQLLLELVEADPENEAAWLWLSQTGGPRAERIGYLRRVLEIDPDNDIARRGLAELEQRQAAARQLLKQPAAPAEPALNQRQFFLLALTGFGLLGCIVLALALFFLYTILQLGDEPPPQPAGWLAAPPAWAAPERQDEAAGCAVEYQVQADDWLSKLAAKYLGDALAFPAIVEATNRRQGLDIRFARIDNPDLIEIGWLLCIPGPAAAPAASLPPAAPPPVPVIPGAAAWETLPAAECQALAQGLEQQLGLAPTAGLSGFSAGPPFEGSGSGCQMTVEATNQLLQAADGLALTAKVEAVLTPAGWLLDMTHRFAAGALSSVSSQYKRGTAQCQLNVVGRLAPEARCPEGLSSTGCFFALPLEQQLYSLRLICAQQRR